MLKQKSSISKEIPLQMVGGTKFGRYPKISEEQTWNMIISDNFLVPYAGYAQVAEISNTGKGRGIFTSVRLNAMIVVIENNVYVVDSDLMTTRVGFLLSFEGDVFIDENTNSQIAICDQFKLYIYDYKNQNFLISDLDFQLGFTPNYIVFQDGYFIAPIRNTPGWRLSQPNDGTKWVNSAGNPVIGGFQTKPDNVVAAVRFPGRENLLFVMGNTVTEPWFDQGLQLFPYARSTGYNIDYGCLNPATIATSDKFVVWLGTNEKSGPVIMYSDGGDAVHISNDGIDFKFAQLTNPGNAYGFLFKQDGHLIYQFTFPSDNLTYAYDFNTQKFFSLCNPQMDAHIAKRVTFFNDTYYFISFIDGNLYELNTKYTTQNGAVMPRIRITNNIRMPDQSRFIINNLNFTIEQGVDFDPGAVDLSISRDGGQTFGTILRQNLNPIGQYRNKLDFWQLGQANDLVAQVRFWISGRIVLTDGTVSIYQ